MGFRDSKGGISSVCYECQDRHPACHDTCEKYVNAKTEYEERKAKIKTERDKFKEIDVYHLEAVRRTRKIKCKSKIYLENNHKR
jgi:hypothetical protein